MLHSCGQQIQKVGMWTRTRRSDVTEWVCPMRKDSTRCSSKTSSSWRRDNSNSTSVCVWDRMRKQDNAVWETERSKMCVSEWTWQRASVRQTMHGKVWAPGISDLTNVFVWKRNRYSEWEWGEKKRADGEGYNDRESVKPWERERGVCDTFLMRA